MTKDEEIAQLKAELELAKNKGRRGGPLPAAPDRPPKPRQTCEKLDKPTLNSFRCLFCQALMGLPEDLEVGDQFECAGCDRYYVHGEPFARRDVEVKEEVPVP